VLIVDDSVVVRRLLTGLVNDEPTCEVVGSAANGKIALARIEHLQPDIVTLDVEMPEMDGLETLTAIRKLHPRLPVIMFSAVTERAADATLRALALGATDYVTKPSAGRDGMQQVRDELIPKLRCLARLPPAPVRATPVPPKAAASEPRAIVHPWQAARVDVVAIGSSTGGPNALGAIVPRLVTSFPVPIVITQHMPPLFTRLLAERLNAGNPVSVRESAGGELLEAGCAYVARGDHHLETYRDGAAVRLRLNRGEPENSCRPSVDVMLRSVVASFGPHVLAVVLTGMGQDGLRGCEAVRDAGGQVVVQDEPTSVVWGMPGAVAKAGLAELVLPLDSIAAEINRRVARAR
jgi:two-component system chemotaxis response regulator CheB